MSFQNTKKNTLSRQCTKYHITYKTNALQLIFTTEIKGMPTSVMKNTYRTVSCLETDKRI